MLARCVPGKKKGAGRTMQGPSHQDRVTVPVSYITSPLAPLLHVLSLSPFPPAISILY